MDRTRNAVKNSMQGAEEWYVDWFWSLVYFKNL